MKLQDFFSGEEWTEIWFIISDSLDALDREVREGLSRPEDVERAVMLHLALLEKFGPQEE